MPVPSINVVRICLLLVNISFVGDFENGVEKGCTELVSPLPVSLLVADAHFIVSVFETIKLSIHLVFHRLQHFFLSPLSRLSIDLSSFFIASLSKLTVIDDNLFALLSSPSLIDKLFLLLSLPPKSLKNLILAASLLHFLICLLLIDDKLSSTAFPILSVCFADYFLILRTKPCCGESHRHVSKIAHLGSRCSDALSKRVLDSSHSLAGN